MTRVVILSAGPLVLFAAFVMSACGSSRHLQNVTVAPASADAQSFPGGQVPFVAMGTFNSPPSPARLTNKDVMWCVGGPTNVANPTAGLCAGNIDTGATVDQNGVAQCNSGFVGTATILVGTVASAPMNPDGGAQLRVFGSAKLTCP